MNVLFNAEILCASICLGGVSRHRSAPGNPIEQTRASMARNQGMAKIHASNPISTQGETTWRVTKSGPDNVAAPRKPTPATSPMTASERLAQATRAGRLLAAILPMTVSGQRKQAARAGRTATAAGVSPIEQRISGACGPRFRLFDNFLNLYQAASLHEVSSMENRRAA
jgi:hypothetical protein